MAARSANRHGVTGKWWYPGMSVRSNLGDQMRVPDGKNIRVVYEVTPHGPKRDRLVISDTDMALFRHQTRRWLTELGARQGWTFEFEDD